MPAGAASARLALKSTHHVVCVRGPDSGLVLPLPCAIGREGTGLDAPLLSRRHVLVKMRGARVSVTDLGSRNGTVVRWGPVSRRIPEARERILMPRSRILAGGDVFVVRSRPSSLAQVRGRRPRRSALFVLPVLSLSLFIIPRVAGRVVLGVPLLPACGIALAALALAAVVFMLHRRRAERDLGVLALRLAMRAAGSGQGGKLPEHDSLRILLPALSPVRVVDVGSVEAPRAIACMGPGGARMADVIAASLIARLGGGRLDLADGRRLIFGHERIRVHILDSSSPAVSSDLDTHGSLRADVPCFRIGVASDIAHAPEWCETLFSAQECSLSHSWWDQFGADDPARNLPTCLDLDTILESAAPEDSDVRTSLSVPIGADAQGLVRLDLVHDGPHALIAGTTGSGKSEALLTWLKALCSTYSPSQLRLILIDYKGGATFSPLACLAHVDAVFTDLGSEGTARAIRGLLALMHAREREFARLTVPDYSARCLLEEEGAPPPRILVVVDEFAALIDAHPHALDAMNTICAQGRSLGIHLIASTQRPAGAIPASMRQNLDLRVALRCVSESDSLDLVGTPDAARLDRIPGRALIQGKGVVHFALSSRWSEPVWPGDPSPLPWAPYFPETITVDELLRLNERSTQPGTFLGVPIALVDGIEEGAHHLLYWRGGQILLRADPDENELAAQGARSIGAALSLSQGMRLRCLDTHCDGSASVTDQAEDILLELEAAREGDALVLVFPECAKIRTLLAQVYGPLRADELFTEGIRAAQASGCVIVTAWTGGRFSSEAMGGGHPFGSAAPLVLSRSSDPFETLTSSSGASLSGVVRRTGHQGRRPASEHHWWIRHPSSDPRLVCLPLVDHRYLNAPHTVRPWAHAHTGCQKGEKPSILFGPSWTPLKTVAEGSWLIVGDRENHAARAIEHLARKQEGTPPEIHSLPATAWTQALSDEDSQLLILNPNADMIRAFSHAAIPLPPVLQHRCDERRRGIARIHGRWVRCGIVYNESKPEKQATTSTVRTSTGNETVI